MRGATVRIERTRAIAAPAARVWAWMTRRPALPLFTVNVFHAAARADAAALAVGARIEITHRFLGRRELRVAHIATLRAAPDGGGEIGWGERTARGDDWFPHGQRFTVTARGPERCMVTNRLRGTFRLPGAGWWLVPWYRHVLPRILDAENARIAAAAEREEAHG